jgi:hypothetical protein
LKRPRRFNNVDAKRRTQSPFENARNDAAGCDSSWGCGPPTTRGQMAAIEKKTKRCPTDLTDAEWERVEPLLPRPAGRSRSFRLPTLLGYGAGRSRATPRHSAQPRRAGGTVANLADPSVPLGACSSIHRSPGPRSRCSSSVAAKRPGSANLFERVGGIHAPDTFQTCFQERGFETTKSRLEPHRGKQWRLPSNLCRSSMILTKA